MMKIVFFGSGAFAVTILEAIDRSRFDARLVVTRPDRRKGRHLHMAPTPVKSFALTHRLNVFQPQDVNAKESIEILRQTQADLFLVVSYGRILSVPVLSLTRLGSINIHSSLLPKYRGAAPVAWALIRGEKKTGVSFIAMNAKMDAGDLILQKAVAIAPEDHAISLDQKLSHIAASQINRVLGLAQKGRIRARSQDGRRVSYAPLLKKEDGLIRWHDDAKAVIHRFKGCYGWPGTFTRYRSKLLKVFDMKWTGGRFPAASAGTILKASDNQLVVACGKGAVIITEVLPESHKRMSVTSFLAGHDVRVGETLGMGTRAEKT